MATSLCILRFHRELTTFAQKSIPKTFLSMRKSKMWMFAAILTCGLMMTSCAVEDRPVAPASGTGGGTAGGTSDEEYKIVVGEGMTKPENAFLKVAAVAGDQNIINALKAIDKVTDVKAFSLFERYDYWTAKKISKTAYYFNYKQDIDHNNHSKGWFKQQCVLTVKGKDRPTVLHTEGYALDFRGINHGDSCA